METFVTLVLVFASFGVATYIAWKHPNWKGAVCGAVTLWVYLFMSGTFLIGRYGTGGPPFFYLAVLFDVSGNANSPYTDGYGRTIPIIRGGIQVPLFQGKNNNDYDNGRENERRRPRNYERY